MDQYARMLEHDRKEAMNSLTQCEAALAASREVINQERLYHRASQEELTFERERHKETVELLERVFEEARRSGEIADSLGCQIATLQAASSSGIAQVVPQDSASMKAPLGKESPKPLDALPEACASSQFSSKHSSKDEKQQEARPVNIDPSNGPEHKWQLQTIETQSSTSRVTGSTSAIEGADKYKRSKRSKRVQ
jgi:hypothetical protein